jgi:uncharacterized protein (DUF2267 family)
MQKAQTVKHEDLVHAVQKAAALPGDAEAEMLFHSFLRVLGARLPEPTAENLAAQLPAQTAEYLTRDQAFQRLDLNQFLNAVWEPLADWASREETQRQVSAALAVLRESIPGVIDKLPSQLPADFAPLFGRPPAG